MSKATLIVCVGARSIALGVGAPTAAAAPAAGCGGSAFALGTRVTKDYGGCS